MNIESPKTYAFIDASNLFYGGEKSLGWKIDYQKLLQYLQNKYQASKIFYFGGVELHKFKYDYLTQETVPINELEMYLVQLVKNDAGKLNDAELALLARHLRRVRFYLKLAKFGYTLYLKPVKRYEDDDGDFRRKANCDVDMAFHLMLEQENFDRAFILSGDGDFLPVLKHMRKSGKEVLILARGPRTAKEIRQFAGSNFRDFVRLESALRFEEKEEET